MIKQYKTFNDGLELNHALVSDDPFRLGHNECSFVVEGTAGKQWLQITSAFGEIRADIDAHVSTQNDQGVLNLGQTSVPSEEEALLLQQRLWCKNQEAIIRVHTSSPSNLYVIPIADRVFHFKPSVFFASSDGLHYAGRSKKALSDYELARHYLFASCFGEGLLCLASPKKLLSLAVTERLSLPMMAIAGFSQKVRLIPETLDLGGRLADLICEIIGGGEVWVTADALHRVEAEALYDTATE